MRPKKQGLVTAGPGLILTLSIALHPILAWADDAGQTAKDASVQRPPSTSSSPVAAQGLQIYRDPQTGQIGPPPPGARPLELSPAERRMLSHSEEGLPPPRVLPGGGVALDLQGRFRNMAVGTVGSNGQAAVGCADTPEQAAADLQADQPAAAGSER